MKRRLTVSVRLRDGGPPSVYYLYPQTRHDEYFLKDGFLVFCWQVDPNESGKSRVYIPIEDIAQIITYREEY